MLPSTSDGAPNVSACQSHVPEVDNPDTSTSQSAPLPWTSNEAPNPSASLIPEKGTPDHSISQIELPDLAFSQSPDLSIRPPSVPSSCIPTSTNYDGKRKVVHLPNEMSARAHIQAAFEISDNVHQEIIDEIFARGEQEASNFFGSWVNRTFL